MALIWVGIAVWQYCFLNGPKHSESATKQARWISPGNGYAKVKSRKSSSEQIQERLGVVNGRIIKKLITRAVFYYKHNFTLICTSPLKGEGEHTLQDNTMSISSESNQTGGLKWHYIRNRGKGAGFFFTGDRRQNL